MADTKTTENIDLTKSITKELGDFVKSKSSTFACGGFIPLTSGGAGEAATGTANTTPIPSISLRWDSSSSTTGVAKLSFPIDNSIVDHKDSLSRLVRNCQPASFGYKGEDVLDESYRKATKMDRSVFSIDFCPYELGIIDTIAQVLLPSADGSTSTKGVKAELYKLNIYAAPSGFFKPHVDTPRSDVQFGSLVVSLPCYHKGGQLIVRHAGQSITFDWASTVNADTSVQWAAFYSDCEHEVLEVTEGHRITLTYNLYYAPGIGDLAGNSPIMDVTSLPLFHKVQEALSESKFMSDGGNLGVFCQHAYAHSTPEGIDSFPRILKGADMAVYAVFLALGLDVSIRPVLDYRNNWRFNPRYYYDSDNDYDDGLGHKGEDYVGDALRETHVTTVGGYEEPTMEVLEAFGGEWMKVNWLTKPTKMNLGMVHLTYGNEPGINHLYTHAALIVSVPPASKRGTK